METDVEAGESKPTAWLSENTSPSIHLPELWEEEINNTVSILCFGKVFTSRVLSKHHNIKSDEETEAGHFQGFPKLSPKTWTPTQLHSHFFLDKIHSYPLLGSWLSPLRTCILFLCTWGSQGPCSPHPRLGIMTAGSLYRSLQHTHATVLLTGELGIWNPSHPPCPTELLTSPPFTPALEHVGSRPTVHKGSPLTILFAPGKEWLGVTFCVTHKSIIF